MALNKASLASALQGIFDGSADVDPPAGADGFPSTALAAANKLASAYTDYASTAMFGSSTVNVAAQEAALAATLAASLTLPGTAATHAAAWGSGLVAFWSGVPVTGAQTGTTVPPAGAAVLIAVLTALFSVTTGSAASVASDMADALDVCTKTVTAAVTPPPGTILPIS